MFENFYAQTVGKFALHHCLSDPRHVFKACFGTQQIDGEETALQTRHHIGSQCDFIVMTHFAHHMHGGDGEYRMTGNPHDKHADKQRACQAQHPSAGDVHQSHVQRQLWRRIAAHVHGVACFHACEAPVDESSRASASKRTHKSA